MKPDWTDRAWIALMVAIIVVCTGIFAALAVGFMPPVPDSWTHR